MKKSVLLLVACLGMTVWAGPAEIKKGETLFKAKCIACHNPASDAAAPKVTDISATYNKKDAKKAADNIAAFIVAPSPAKAIVPKAFPTKKWGPMPALPNTPADAKLIAEYIASLAKK